MRKVLIFFLIFYASIPIKAQCESVTLQQEFEMTQNIAIVHAKEIQGDSILVEVVKKWKGDSIGKFVKFEIKEFNLETFRLDTGKTYILFWFNAPKILAILLSGVAPRNERDHKRRHGNLGGEAPENF